MVARPWKRVSVGTNFRKLACWSRDFSVQSSSKILGREGDIHRGSRKALAHTSRKLPPWHLSQDESLDSGTQKSRKSGCRIKWTSQRRPNLGKKVISTDIFQEFYFTPDLTRKHHSSLSCHIQCKFSLLFVIVFFRENKN